VGVFGFRSGGGDVAEFGVVVLGVATVYRKELRPVLTRGAEAMDIVFNTGARNETVDRQLDRHVADSDGSSSDVEPGMGP
jgi:hypothetical protein